MSDKNKDKEERDSGREKGPKREIYPKPDHNKPLYPEG